MSVVVVTPPTTFAVTLAEALAHLRVSTNEDDTYISSVVIPGAQALIEEMTGRTLTTTTLRLGLENWPDECEIVLPGPPVASVSSITYLDENNIRQTLAASQYTLDADRAPGLVVPAYGVTWPTALDFPGSIKVTYVAGWASIASIPASLRAAVLLACGHKYENREATNQGGTVLEIPVGIKHLCAPWDVREKFA